MRLKILWILVLLITICNKYCYSYAEEAVKKKYYDEEVLVSTMETLKFLPDDKKLHILVSNNLFILGGDGGETPTGVGLIALLDAFIIGAEKECHDRGYTDDETKIILTPLINARQQVMEFDKISVDRKLDQGDLLADITGLGCGLLKYGVRELKFRYADEEEDWE